jgi:LysR family transcriptional regulator, low CO2-responsive transcriptional regulator
VRHGPAVRTIRDVRLENVSPLRLRLLLEVQRRGSIATAADACAVGQPSASTHLRTLEAATGHMLLHRNGRGSGLTDAGRVVAGHAARILAVLDEMQDDLETLQNGTQGTLAIAVSATASVAVLPAALQRFTARHPGISVSVTEAPSAVVLRRVAQGDVDLGIAGETRADFSVERRTILDDELVGVAARDRLRLRDGRAELGELDRNTVLVGPRDSSTRAVTERYLARAGFRPSRVWEFDSEEAILRAVRVDLGISFLSRLRVTEACGRGDVVTFRVAGVEPMMRSLQLVWPRDRALSPAAAAFAEAVEPVGSLEGGE